MTPTLNPAVQALAVVDPTSVRRVQVDVERRGDAEPREFLLDRAFGPARFAKTCERLRGGRLPAAGLSLVARPLVARPSLVGGGAGRAAGHPIVGTVRLWHVAAGEGRAALMLGPLAVESDWRCAKVGATLMAEAIARARALGHRAILLVGDEPYYRRFGFTRRPVLDLRMPGPVEAERFLGLELVHGALAGATGLVQATGAIDIVARLASRRADDSRASLRRVKRPRAA